MSDRTYTRSDMEAAMLLWEELTGVLGNPKRKHHEVVGEMLGNHGSGVLRAACVDLVDAAEMVWNHMSEAEQEDQSWDFDFIPDFLDKALANGMFERVVNHQYEPHSTPWIVQTGPAA